MAMMELKIIQYFNRLSKYFQVCKTGNSIVMPWKSKGLSSKIIKPPTTTNNSLNLRLDSFDNLTSWVKYEGSCLETIIKPYTPNSKIINLYIVYEIQLWPFQNSGKFATKNSLFGTVTLAKNADRDNKI